MSNTPSEMEIYFFDLRGYLILKNALTIDEVAELNAALDLIPPIKKGEWYGYVHGQSFGENDGLNFQQIYEAGEPFEKLIDHPSWINKVRYLSLIHI